MHPCSWIATSQEEFRSPTDDSDSDLDVKRDEAPEVAQVSRPRSRGEKVRIDFTPNPNKKGHRGRRGKVFTGIADLQADFEMDRQDRAGLRIKGLAARRRAVEKRDLSRSSSRKLRGFRGKKSTKTLDEDVGVVGRYASKVFARGTKMNKRDSAEFRIQKARRARLKSGREFKPKKTMQTTLEARYDLCELVARFKRTGKLPNRSVRVPDLEASDQTHVVS